MAEPMKMTSEQAAEHQRTEMNAEVEYLGEWGTYGTYDCIAAFNHRCGYTVYAEGLDTLRDIVQKILKLRKEHTCG